MKKIVIACLLSLGLTVVGTAQEPAAKPAPAPTFKAGKTPIVIPPPTKEMSEVGYDRRELMEIFVPAQNRLIAAFALTDDLPKLENPSDDFIMSKYAMVQVSRRLEYMDCEPDNFKEIAEGAKKAFGEIISSSMKDVEEEFNKKMKALNLEEATVNLGKPIQLGCLFSKPDAYGFGMIMPITLGGKNIKMSMGGAFIRVKKRLLFVYLYSEYKDENTIKWLRKKTEAWVDAILAANK